MIDIDLLGAFLIFFLFVHTYYLRTVEKLNRAILLSQRVNFNYFYSYSISLIVGFSVMSLKITNPYAITIFCMLLPLFGMLAFISSLYFLMIATRNTLSVFGITATKFYHDFAGVGLITVILLTFFGMPFLFGLVPVFCVACLTQWALMSQNAKFLTSKQAALHI